MGDGGVGVRRWPLMEVFNGGVVSAGWRRSRRVARMAGRTESRRIIKISTPMSPSGLR